MQNPTQARTARNPVVQPIAQAFLDALVAEGGPQINELSVEDARNVLTALQSGNVARLPADIEDREIPAGSAGSIDVRIVRPKGSSGMLPVVVYLHGGGWVLGDKNTHDRLIRENHFALISPAHDRLNYGLARLARPGHGQATA